MTNQSYFAIAIGSATAANNQGAESVAIGHSAAQANQGTYAIAIGTQAGFNSQQTNAIAIGYNAGYSYQSQNGIAIGYQAGQYSQGQNAISIGAQNGSNNQGQYAIAIGTYGAINTQGANSIILNATGNTVDSLPVNSIQIVAGGAGNRNTSQASGSTVIAPIRTMAANTYTHTALYYNTAANEICQSLVSGSFNNSYSIGTTATTVYTIASGTGGFIVIYGFNFKYMGYFEFTSGTTTANLTQQVIINNTNTLTVSLSSLNIQAAVSVTSTVYVRVMTF
jgi:hypothetical protein